jgi:asparagine synthase (glutamine-hydrolysing)
MCGIVGIHGEGHATSVEEMLACITHRGPDDHGIHKSGDLEMGARRLSIVDLAHGAQPMYNEDGSVVVVFNGEIYNHVELRSELRQKGHTFETNCDTEVLVHLWEEYGEELTGHLEGMFAFSLWDRDASTLFLARDRLGIKPLYFVEDGGTLLWASEIQPLLKAGIDRTVDEQAVYEYFSLGYSLWPRTLFKNVRKLAPGTSITVTEDGLSTRSYWKPSTTTRTMGPDEASKTLRRVLERSVEKRLMADVPVGAFLSGGLDSSAIVGLLSEYTDDVNTYSVGFEREDINEQDEAEFVADHFGTTHHRIDVDFSSLENFEDLVSRFGEPVADPAALPSLLLARRAREDVKVVLTGVGADELFAGYRYHKLLDRHRSLVRRLPRASFSLADSVASRFTFGRKYTEHLGALESDESAYLYWRQRANRPFEEYVTSDGDDERLRARIREAFEGAPADDTCKRLQLYDTRHYVSDDLLYLLDHMTMAASLEGRVPFLDHELVDFGLSIPSEYKLDGANKPVLRRAVSDIVPDRTLAREKQPFTVPVREWFRSGHQVVETWLSKDRLDRTPHVDSTAVRNVLSSHRTGETDQQDLLWKTLSYVAWYHTHAVE